VFKPGFEEVNFIVGLGNNFYSYLRFRVHFAWANF